MILTKNDISAALILLSISLSTVKLSHSYRRRSHVYTFTFFILVWMEMFLYLVISFSWQKGSFAIASFIITSCRHLSIEGEGVAYNFESANLFEVVYFALKMACWGFWSFLSFWYLRLILFPESLLPLCVGWLLNLSLILLSTKWSRKQIVEEKGNISSCASISNVLVLHIGCILSPDFLHFHIPLTLFPAHFRYFYNFLKIGLLQL